MSQTDFTPTEMMTIAAARALKNTDVCFVGIGAPSAACNIARLTHAPDVTLIYESGTIGTAPSVLPLSIGDGGDHRARLGITTKGPTLMVTDLAVWRPDPVTREFTVVSLHPGVSREMVQAECGWTVRFADSLDETPSPTEIEIDTLRDLNARTKAAHSGDKNGETA